MFLFPSFLCLLAPFLTLEVLPSQRSNKLKKKQKKKKNFKKLALRSSVLLLL
jgi:polyferredoxin